MREEWPIPPARCVLALHGQQLPFDTVDDFGAAIEKLREQGEGEVSMRDRRAKRAFAPGPFDIHVNPLVIAGAGRKLVDPLLVDGQPI